MVEDQVIAHQELDSAISGGVRVVYRAVVAYERVESPALAEVCNDVGARRAGVLCRYRGERLQHRPQGLAHLFLCVRDAEVEIEVAAPGRDPRKAPTHP